MFFVPDLMRQILLLVEARPAGNPINGTLTFDGVAQADANEHIKLLMDDDYLTGLISTDHRGEPRGFLIRGLTMKGHEFLANARNESVWTKVTTQAKEKGHSIGIPILNALLIQAAKHFAGL